MKYSNCKELTIVSLYSPDGWNKKDRVSVAFYIPNLKFGRGTKLKENLSIFSAEALAIVAALRFIEDRSERFWVIITDTMSVLKALQNHQFSAKSSYNIPEIKY
ncbi:unnamed protein product [Pieris macdunnoughi]|uniref:RNase H type-1 domain-containing protein n=1 Tax=Pieris macdunnoughi TaxID=345717 RepID=A0A821UG62_9NEOP|nr:unnamed protein product [Pieris macdunnoughi]